jgi:hypothetical protein
MSRLLTLTAIIEAPTGLALLAVPSFVATLLLGVRLEAPAAMTLARVAGAALLALGVACRLASTDQGGGGAVRGLVVAMVLYNLGAVVILGAVGLGAQPIGILLWPAVLLHAAMATWCLTNLVGSRP